MKAVAQVTKQGFAFVFDRVTGKPALADRGSPGAAVERAWREERRARSRFPTKPAPFEIQGVREDDLIDLTPALRAQALDIISRYDHGPLYTPPSERGAIAHARHRRRRLVVGRRVGSRDPDVLRDDAALAPCARAEPPAAPSAATVTSGRPSSCPGRRIFRCSSRRGAASSRSTCPAATTAGALRSAAASTRAVSGLGITERLGWPSRSFALVTKTVLLVVQTGFLSNRRPAPYAANREVYDLNIREPKLYAYDKSQRAALPQIDACRRTRAARP